MSNTASLGTGTGPVDCVAALIKTHCTATGRYNRARAAAGFREGAQNATAAAAVRCSRWITAAGHSCSGSYHS